MALVTHADVGRPFAQAETQFDEGVRMSLALEGVQLHMILATPTSRFIDAFTSGQVHYRWVSSGAVAMLRLRLTDRGGVEHLPWQEVPYRTRRDHHDGLTPLSRAPGANKPLPVSISLLDASTGIIRAARSEIWPPRVADQIRAVAHAHNLFSADFPAEIRQLTELREAGHLTTNGAGIAWSTFPDQGRS